MWKTSTLSTGSKPRSRARSYCLKKPNSYKTRETMIGLSFIRKTLWSIVFIFLQFNFRNVFVKLIKKSITSFSKSYIFFFSSSSWVVCTAILFLKKCYEYFLIFFPLLSTSTNEVFVNDPWPQPWTSFPLLWGSWSCGQGSSSRLLSL